ncbi:right-handed parallel beta-helix repeat-containing protein [candidate division WOR-3 bacterium]|nr:right-handed parallel beta-helix repeat-containing protein [candidate division WOR-3 bacterium]
MGWKGESIRAFAVTIVITCFLVVSTFMSVNVDATGLSLHDPIVIQGDSEFTAINGVISGIGTENNPYIISNWIINGDTTGYCIKIEYTTKHCKIINCELDGGMILTGAGIYLEETENITIDSNILYENRIGIGMEKSDYCRITNNSITQCTSNGIYTNSATSESLIENNTISNNTGDGINIDACNNITITGNEISNNNIGILLNGFTTEYCLIYHNIIFDNIKQAQEDTGGNNQWDNGEEGNWWGDYTGVDYLLPFGIGDTPYDITNGGEGWANHDRYPLVEFNPINILHHILLSLLILLILMAVMRELFRMSKRAIEGDT